MPKNQNKPKAKKYRRDRNHAESLENIDFFSIIKIKSIILVYYPPALRQVFFNAFLFQRDYGNSVFAFAVNAQA